MKQTLHKEAKQKRARQCMISKLFAIQTVSLIVSTYCFVSSPKLVSANRLISARIHSEYVMLPGFTLAIVANPGQSCFLICDHARPAPSGARGYIYIYIYIYYVGKLIFSLTCCFETNHSQTDCGCRRL